MTTKKNYKSIISTRIHKSLKKIASVFLLLLVVLGYTNIKSTNSFFSDSDTITGNSFTAGHWIPTLSMTVSPELPDGEDGRHLNPPCVKLFSDIDDVTIHYSFTNIETIEGTVAEDACIFPPEGDSVFSAFATNNENSEWISNTLGHDFFVGEKYTESGAVVINEVMWMGSSEHQQDEWIELRNMSPLPIDISGWKIENAAVGNKSLLIPEGIIIPANGYFLISGVDDDKKTEVKVTPNLIDKKLHLKDFKNGDLVLKDTKNKKIDTAPAKLFWLAGWHGFFLHLSMARNDIPGEGKSSSSWHTCINHLANDQDYWKTEGLNFGTPGFANLSVDNILSDDIVHQCDNKKLSDEKNHFRDMFTLDISKSLEQVDEESDKNAELTEEKEDQYDNPSEKENTDDKIIEEEEVVIVADEPEEIVETNNTDAKEAEEFGLGLEESDQEKTQDENTDNENLSENIQSDREIKDDGKSSETDLIEEKPNTEEPQQDLEDKPEEPKELPGPEDIKDLL